MTTSHLSIMRHNIEVAHHKASIALENMGITMRDRHMDPEARQMFRVVRADLEHCLESIANVKLVIDREYETAAEETKS